jgi:hypothetical protein
VRLGVPMVPRLLTTAVGVASAAARISSDSVRSSALDDQSGLFVGLNGPASVIAGAIAQPALTRKSCAPNAAWAGDAYVLTSTYAEAAAAQDTRSFLALDDLLHHFLNSDAIGAILAVPRTALKRPRYPPNTASHGRPPSIPPADAIRERRRKLVLMKRPRRRREVMTYA